MDDSLTVDRQPRSSVYQRRRATILGRANELTSVREADVGVIVNVPTDKAASPNSVLGYSKQMAERLAAGVDRLLPGKFVAWRFGNVQAMAPIRCQAVRPGRMAEPMIALSGRTDLRIEITGLREGEKLHADLFGTAEGQRKTSDPMIEAVPVPALGIHCVRESSGHCGESVMGLGAV